MADLAISHAARAEQRPVTALPGVGAALAERLARLGVTQVQDLLFVLPLRYEDRTRIAPLGTLQLWPGPSGDAFFYVNDLPFDTPLTIQVFALKGKWELLDMPPSAGLVFSSPGLMIDPNNSVFQVPVTIFAPNNSGPYYQFSLSPFEEWLA